MIRRRHWRYIDRRGRAALKRLQRQAEQRRAMEQRTNEVEVVVDPDAYVEAA